MALEIESKFYVHHLNAIEARLKTLGAACLAPRQLETNLRFEDQNNSLSQQHKVLRLRRYDEIRLTFKQGKNAQGGVSTREEIEVAVADFDRAQAILQGLGFSVFFTYEKYRAIYTLDAASICLDELPFGNFVEIEAESAPQVLQYAARLGLNPLAGNPESYQQLFERARALFAPAPESLTFEAFRGRQVSPAALGLAWADGG